MKYLHGIPAAFKCSFDFMQLLPDLRVLQLSQYCSRRSKDTAYLATRQHFFQVLTVLRQCIDLQIVEALYRALEPPVQERNNIPSFCDAQTHAPR